MAASNDYLQYVLEQLTRLARVTSRRMFGGFGLYCDGQFFALIFSDTLYFKVGDATRSDYESRGMSRFRPYRNKPELSMTYYEVPADVLEDGEELVQWARRSVDAALASATKPRSAKAPRGADKPKAPRKAQAPGRRKKRIRVNPSE